MKKRKRFVLGMVIFSVLLTSFSFYFYQLFYGANILTESEPREILVDYDDNFVYYGKKKFERKNGQIAHNGKWKPEGDHSLPWEKFAHNYKRKNA